MNRIQWGVTLRGMNRWLPLLLCVASCIQPTRPDPGPSSVLQRLDDAAAVAQVLAPGAGPHWVHFWALWCTACTAELPRQVEIARRLAAQGTRVTFINLDGYDKSPQVEEHLAHLGATAVARQAQLNMALDVEQVTRLFSPGWGGALPATFLRHPDGSPAAEVMGELNPGEEQKMIEALSMQKPEEEAKPPPP